MKNLLSILLLTGLVLAPVYSTDTAYTYEQLYSSMVVNNTRMAQAEQDIYSAQLTVKDAKSLYQPNIGYNFTTMYMANPPVGQMIVGTDDLLGQIGLPSNTAPNSYVTLYDGMDNSYYSGSLSLTQPLITCGKIPLAVKLAKTNSSLNEIKKSDLERQLETQLNVSLYTLYYINEIYKLVDEAQVDSDELVQISKDAYTAGIMSEQDYLDARIQAQEIDVQRKQLDTQYNNMLQSLRNLVGISDLEFSDIEFTPDENELYKYKDATVDALKSLATADSNRTLQMVGKMKAAADIQEDLAWRSIYGAPDVFMNISAGYGGPKFPFAEVGWRQADNWSVNVVFTISGNLWDGGRTLNSIDKAKSNQKSADISYESTVQTIESAVEAAYNSMQMAISKSEYYSLKDENSQLKLNKLLIEQAEGGKSRSDILQQEVDMIQNNVQLTTEKITLASSVFLLDYLTTN